MEHFIKQLAKEAGSLALSFYGTNLERKEKSDPRDVVTEADETVSQFIIQKILEKYPLHGILSEEHPEIINPESEYLWIVDPIDGTHNFSSGIPLWAVMITLEVSGQLELAVIYSPVSDDLFFAKKGGGAFKNDTKLSVSRLTQLDKAKGIFVQANEAGTYGDYIERFRAMRIRMMQHSKAWIFNYFSIFASCHVATGAYDFHVGNAGLDWDLAPMVLICTEAGAIATDSDGNPWKRGRQDYIVANSELHSQLLRLFTPTIR